VNPIGLRRAWLCIKYELLSDVGAIDIVTERGDSVGSGVFDLVLSLLDQFPEGYRAMDERRAIKELLRP
jgi:hypothetical protein